MYYLYVLRILFSFWSGKKKSVWPTIYNWTKKLVKNCCLCYCDLLFTWNGQKSRYRSFGCEAGKIIYQKLALLVGLVKHQFCKKYRRSLTQSMKFQMQKISSFWHSFLQKLEIKTSFTFLWDCKVYELMSRELFDG